MDDRASVSDFLVLSSITYGGSGSVIVNTDGEVVGLAGGRYAVDRDDAGEWIHMAWAVDVSKHLR